MANVTIRQAAGMAGISRQAMYRLIDSGKVSASVDVNGAKCIDSSELLRHFGRLLSPDEQKQRQTGWQRQTGVTDGQTDTVALQLEIERLKGQLAAKDVEISLLRQRADDLRNDKQEYMAFVERQQRLLPMSKKGK